MQKSDGIDMVVTLRSILVEDLNEEAKAKLELPRVPWERLRTPWDVYRLASMNTHRMIRTGDREITLIGNRRFLNTRITI